MSVIDTCDPLPPLMEEINATAEECIRAMQQGDDVMNEWCRATIQTIGRCITDPSVVLETLKDLTRNFPVKESEPQEDHEENKDSEDNLTQIEERHGQILAGLTELMTNYLQSKMEFDKNAENASLQVEETENYFKQLLKSKQTFHDQIVKLGNKQFETDPLFKWVNDMPD